MKRLNVFADKKEKKELKKLLIKAQNTPVIAFSGAHAMRGGLSADAWEMVRKRTHEIALSKGLPEIKGFYGCDLENGEFLKQS